MFASPIALKKSIFSLGWQLNEILFNSDISNKLMNSQLSFCELGDNLELIDEL